MAPSIVHLPDGQNFTVQPVFSGLFFKSNEINTHPTPFPAGWWVDLHSETSDADDDNKGNGNDAGNDVDGQHEENSPRSRRSHIHKYSRPTLQNDTIYISSISSPSSSDYHPPASASRQIALMMWITLYWYFQQPEPEPYLDAPESRNTPPDARPRGEWRIRVKREGVLRTRNMIPKLERMGLISTLDSAVGTGIDENHQGWDDMYVTKRSFWQIPSGLFLFTLQPVRHASSHPGSPISSRPNSPIRATNTSSAADDSPSPHPHNKSYHHHHVSSSGSLLSVDSGLAGLVSVPGLPAGPYFSPSRLPTHYPPPPLQYTTTNGVRHPVRPKPPRMGEIFYTRFVPSVGKYLSLRVASLSPKPVPSQGPVGPASRDAQTQEQMELLTMDDTSLLKKWLKKPRVSAFWGDFHERFLSDALRSRHSFPVIGLWDGVPFGYFEIYWVREDLLGHQLGSSSRAGAVVDDFDRGLHVLVGEEWARGRVQQWLSGLVHWCWQVDNRTMNIYLEPRVDNARFLRHLEEAGFSKDRQVAFPHKQSWVCRMQRDTWDGPVF